VGEVARIAVAASARTAGHSLHGEEKNQIRYLCGKEWREIGWLSGTHAVPHPIRTYNNNGLFLGAFGELLWQ
jgi:hypothetical protein